ncbi:TonB-dependent receptor plug domain-containing protein [Novosphingobium nitrogenifigens]|nr:TonB-dependent receptor [Novosphingobium nitrogenifigens]
MKKSHVVAVLLASAAHPAFAREATALPPIDVETVASPATITTAPSTITAVTREDLRARQANSSDIAGLLSDIPGVAINTGGGFSGMPTIHGLSEQRLAITVDGHPVDSACPNDMNTPMSYTDPQTVGEVRVITGVSPVSLSGDSIGAVIDVRTPAPRFSRSDSLLLTGEVSAFYRSNDDGAGGAVTLTAATRSLSATYTGSFTSAGRYSGGGDLGLVHSSEYRKTDHQLALAWQGAIGLVEVKGGYHYSPYEGFVNQYMDMTSNKSWFLNAHWHNEFAWGALDLKADYRSTDHEMNFLDDKGGSADGGMPMNTHVRSGGYTLKADIPLGPVHTLHFGQEYHRETMNDWWPPVAGSMMMSPDTFLNINNGERTRIGGFGEWEARWSDKLSTLAGVRYDHVAMNTGAVQPYGTGMMNMADATAAAAFNAIDRRRADNNWSGSFLASYAAAKGLLVELGYAHKTRSPNLYERYTWGTGSMSSRMIGWYGDGNGYVGNPDLKPERADTFSLTVTAGDPKQGWSVKATPYYTHVNDYIDATFVKAFTTMMGVATGFNQLRFANVEAEFYGVDAAVTTPWWDNGALGKTRVTSSLSWVEGQNVTTQTPLYHQMPLDIKVAIRHALGAFEAGADVEWVDAKTRVDPARNEPQTPAYALLALRTAYTWKTLRLSVDVENLLDKAYYLPLGGISLGDYSASGGTIRRAVPGRGRSVNLGLSARF